MAFLVSSTGSAAEGTVPQSHPLDPLSAAEIDAATSAVKAAKGLAETARFVYVSLYEPAKADIIANDKGSAPKPPRLVRVVIRERAERATYEGIVALDESQGTAALTSWKQVPGVQPSVMLEEFFAAEELVREDPRWRDAMRKRGVTDFDLCMIDPWSTPNVEPGVGPGDGRFVSPLTWVRTSLEDNGYARPVENLLTRGDLDTMTVVEVTDLGVIPIPTTPANYSAQASTDPVNVPYCP